MTSLLLTSFDGTQIDINVCRPGGASADDPVPVVLQSHGWGGEKASCLGRTSFFDAGIGFASMTQRGNGSSTGQNNVMDPDLEGRDIMAVIDHLASLDWVLKEDGPDGDDPVLGGLGGSYGGGFQWVGAFSDQYFRGEPTRFDALHPGNTWYDLRRSLAPNDVMRTVMVEGLYAAGVASNDLAPWVHASMAAFTASGQVVDGPAPTNFASEIHQHSAAWFVERGERLDIPVFVQQGAGDLVFNLNEGLDALHLALTPEARSASLFANHQGGHSINRDEVPSGPVPYTPRSDELCPVPEPLEWFKHTLLGQPMDLGPRFLLRTVAGRCIGVDELPAKDEIEVSSMSQTALPTGPRGVARFEQLAEGPLTIAGAPTLSFSATTPDPDSRLFWGLAVGPTPEDAQLVGAQWMPTRIAGPALAAELRTELGGVVVDVNEGENLYLVSSPSADQFIAHSSRHPGAVVVDAVTVGLPLLDPPARVAIDAPAAGTFTDEVTVSATVTVRDEPLAGADVTFSLGSQSMPATTDQEGIATVELPLVDQPGEYELTVGFAGSERAGAADAGEPFTIEREITDVIGGTTGRSRGENVDLVAWLAEDDGPVVPGRTVEFRVRDQVFTAVTNGEGVAHVTAVIPDHGRSLEVQVVFPGDGSFRPSSDTVTIRWGR